MRIAFHRPTRSVAVIGALLLALLAAPALGMMPVQTFADPVGDNCRYYGLDVYHCGPDIEQVVFSAPGDGLLHVNVSYASLPATTNPEFPPQVPEFVDLGIYPPAATTAKLFALPDTYRVAQTAPGEWTLTSITDGFKVIGTAAATVRPLGIELAVPFSRLGFPWLHRYAVNAGSAGETIPEHPDLAPDIGLFELVEEAPAPPVTPKPGGGISATTPSIKGLSGISGKQRGKAISGTIDVSVGGDLTIEALVPTAKSKLTGAGRLTKRGVGAGKVSFRMTLASSARRKLAGRQSKVTLRLTLKPFVGATVRQSRVVSLTVPR